MRVAILLTGKVNINLKIDESITIKITKII